MADMKPSVSIFMILMSIAFLYYSWTLWRRVWRDWAMAARGHFALATVIAIAPEAEGDAVQWVLITAPRHDGTTFEGRVRLYRGQLAVGDHLQVRYDPVGHYEPRLVDQWRWKAAAASITGHAVYLFFAAGTTFVGLGVIARAVESLVL